jgi:hypothetical protein
VPYVAPPPDRRPNASPWPFVGIGALVCLGFVDGASILFLPWWGVAVLIVIWIGLLVQGVRWFTPRPRGTVVLAGAGVAAWLVAVLLAALAS